MRMPKVSVVMPVYNGEGYMRAAIDSILAQSFKDFELVIINDGSSDGSARIIESYCDPRIVYVNRLENTGLANVRNTGLDIARGEYIAWLDCDDISLPERLQKQVNLLDANPSIGLCGTWVQTIDNFIKEDWRYPTDPDFLRARMLFDDPLATSSIMMRAACVRERDLRFNPNHPPAEDYELWERISREWKVTNIAEVLTLYRIHSAQTSALKVDKQKASVWEVQNRILFQLGIKPSEQEKNLHLDIGVGWRFTPEPSRLKEAEQWLLKLKSANQIKGSFSQAAFNSVLGERWLYICRGAINNGLDVWNRFNRSPLREYASISSKGRFILLMRALFRWTW